MSKTLQVGLLILLGAVLLAGAFSGGFIAGHILPFANSGINGMIPAAAPPTVEAAAQSATSPDLQILFKPFWETWQIIHTQYVDLPVDDKKLMEGAIRGMMDSLGDQHSTYMDPQTFKDTSAELSGSYEGIGATVDTSGPYLTIISTFPSSPAEQAGVLAGDAIVALDHQDMTGIDPEIVRQKVLGPAGTQVGLTIQREGVITPVQIDITRAKILVTSASGKMLSNELGYVQVTTFGDHTMRELKDTLKTLLAQHPKGLILDLRDNGGGYLQTAVEVVSQFQSSGTVLYEQNGNGTKKAYDTIPGGMATKIPLVVLINEGTASASEITAGALQDNQRAKLVGVTSYGKGSVQNWIAISNNEGAVRITIARWLTPDERQIDKKGLTPDVYVQRTPEDRQAGRDPQLDRAVVVLTNLINGQPIPTAIPAVFPTPTEAVQP